MKNGILVIKVGSAILVNTEGSIHLPAIKNIVEGIVYAKKNGYMPILVTSGAVASGGALVGKKVSKGTRAAVGQPLLMQEYEKAFAEHSVIVGQYLITREDFSDRKRYICLQSSLEEAFCYGVIPIINDNDVLHEARESFSDNDQLACYLGIMLNAQKVIILTSVDGIYTDFGTPNAKKINDIYDDSLFDTIKTPGKTSVGTGGMEGKMKSVRLAMNSGVDCFIVNGKTPDAIIRVLQNDDSSYTYIHGVHTEKTKKGIQKWLFAGANPKGAIIMSDEGALRLQNRLERKSVLAKGVVSVSGVFEKGDVIAVYDAVHALIGYGVTKVSSDEIREHRGENNVVVIHADYFLVL